MFRMVRKSLKFRLKTLRFWSFRNILIALNMKILGKLRKKSKEFTYNLYIEASSFQKLIAFSSKYFHDRYLD